MNRIQALVRYLATVASVVVSLLLPSARAVTIDMVTVGDAGNAADTNGYGSVNYQYQIGMYDVTIGQYVDFLNAVAASDPYGLYSPSMATNLNVAGISRAGSSGSYTYSAIGPFGSTPSGASSPSNRPITYVSWWDAARFANWMQNGQGAGDTDTGAYTLGGATSGAAPAKNPGAQFYIPTENEWYKAAYYKGGGTNAGYWTYATQSDSLPSNAINAGSNQANFNNYYYSVTQSHTYSAGQNYLTEVGAFTGSVSAYGTFDQAGNVYQWNDLDGAAGSNRGYRGGAWYGNMLAMASFNRQEDPSGVERNDLGFRLASFVAGPASVPEINPADMGSVLALIGGGLGLLERRRKRG